MKRKPAARVRSARTQCECKEDNRMWRQQDYNKWLGAQVAAIFVDKIKQFCLAQKKEVRV